MTSERERFEAAMREHRPNIDLRRHPGGYYTHDRTLEMWRGWQACVEYRQQARAPADQAPEPQGSSGSLVRAGDIRLGGFDGQRVVQWSKDGVPPIGTTLYIESPVAQSPEPNQQSAHEAGKAEGEPKERQGTNLGQGTTHTSAQAGADAVQACVLASAPGATSQEAREYPELHDQQLDCLRDAHEREWGSAAGIYSYESFRKLFRSVIAADRKARQQEALDARLYQWLRDNTHPDNMRKLFNGCPIDHAAIAKGERHE